LCAGVEVRRLDLRDEAARQEVEALLDRADLLITAMRGGALRRLGLDWQAIHARHSRLCHLAIVGEAAPNDDRAGHDLTYQARAGLLSPPAMPRTVYADLFAAERAVAAALAALHQRDASGEGVRAEIAIADGAAILADAVRHGLTSAEGPLGGGSPLYRLYRASDGWIALAALEPHFRERLPEALRVPRADAESLTSRFAQESCAYWERIASEFDLPLARVENGAAQ
jgi:crotonobetainyl-CoA:carnitine CoA-transferase CaiB-like acyl-CoA transferase